MSPCDNVYHIFDTFMRIRHNIDIDPDIRDRLLFLKDFVENNRFTFNQYLSEFFTIIDSLIYSLFDDVCLYDRSMIRDLYFDRVVYSHLTPRSIGGWSLTVILIHSPDGGAC